MIVFFLSFISSLMFVSGQIARHIYQNLRRQTASTKIQSYMRMHFKRVSYKQLWSCSIVIQSGLRGMVSRIHLKFRRHTRAAIIIQVLTSSIIAPSSAQMENILR